jgi:penicillin-binding protein-related factor A (putative recombinase)
VKEKDYYSRITAYYEKNATNSIAWEAKITKSGRLPFNALAPHQEEKLLKAETVHGEKLPDIGLARKSFDGFVLHRAEANILVIYYRPHDTEIYEIPIRAFVNEKYASKEKSLSRMRAAEIGTRIYL